MSSSYAFNYIINQNQAVNGSRCFQTQPAFETVPFRGQAVDFVDASTVLSRGITPNKCDSIAYPVVTVSPRFNIRACDSTQLVPISTRLENKDTNKIDTLVPSRFVPLAQDPQSLSSIHHNAYIGQNSRLTMKDSI